MGQSTDAILCFGRKLSEEDVALMGEDGDWISGSNIVMHCSDSYTEYILVAKDSVVTARRGYPEKITSLEIKDGWLSEITAAEDEHSLEHQEPNWWLCSWWGY